uniref:PH domain-containing protein n=1 Tax=Elaeophora elaphi TaxID=1147741 RepID=A0A0R3RIP6_9BILA
MNLHQPQPLTPVPESDTDRESTSTVIISSATSERKGNWLKRICINVSKLLSNPRENHLLHPLSNYASRKIGRQELSSFHYQQQQHIGHRSSFIRRLSAAIPSLSTDSMPFAAVSSLLP